MHVWLRDGLRMAERDFSEFAAGGEEVAAQAKARGAGSEPAAGKGE